MLWTSISWLIVTLAVICHLAIILIDIYKLIIPNSLVALAFILTLFYYLMKVEMPLSHILLPAGISLLLFIWLYIASHQQLGIGDIKYVCCLSLGMSLSTLFLFYFLISITTLFLFFVVIMYKKHEQEPKIAFAPTLLLARIGCLLICVN